MVVDKFPDKKGAKGWATHSRKKGYNVSVYKVKGGYAVSRTRRKRR